MLYLRPRWWIIFSGNINFYSSKSKRKSEVLLHQQRSLGKNNLNNNGIKNRRRKVVQSVEWTPQKIMAPSLSKKILELASHSYNCDFLKIGTDSADAW